LQATSNVTPADDDRELVEAAYQAATTLAERLDRLFMVVHDPDATLEEKSRRLNALREEQLNHSSVLRHAVERHVFPPRNDGDAGMLPQNMHAVINLLNLAIEKEVYDGFQADDNTDTKRDLHEIFAALASKPKHNFMNALAGLTADYELALRELRAAKAQADVDNGGCLVSARDDVEEAYEIANSIDLALLNISAASENDRWPDPMYFEQLTKAFAKRDVVSAACEWIPPQLIQVCGANEPTTHEALLVLADAAIRCNLVARARPAASKGELPAKDWFAIFADYPAGKVNGLLKVERRQALDAIRSAEAAEIKEAKAKRRLAGEADKTNAGPEIDKKTRAVAALLTIGPNATKIAKAIGVKRTTLLGWPEFRQRFDQLKADAEVRKRRLPRGRKSKGEIEAYENGDDDADETDE
jgi:hypothetical protein